MLLRWRSNTNISYNIFFFCNFALLQLIFALLLLCFHHLPIFPIAILHFCTCIIALLKAKEKALIQSLKRARAFWNHFISNVKHVLSDHLLQWSSAVWKIRMYILWLCLKGESATVQDVPMDNRPIFWK